MTTKKMKLSHRLRNRCSSNECKWVLINLLHFLCYLKQVSTTRNVSFVQFNSIFKYLPPSLCLCMSICLSPSFPLSVSISVSVCLSVCLSLSVSLRLCLYLCLSLPLSLSLCLCRCLPLSLSLSAPALTHSISLSLAPSVFFCLLMATFFNMYIFISLILSLALNHNIFKRMLRAVTSPFLIATDYPGPVGFRLFDILPAYS